MKKLVSFGVQFIDGTVTNGSQNFKDVNGDGQLVVGQNNALDDNVDFDVLGNGVPDLEIGWSNQITIGEYNKCFL